MTVSMLLIFLPNISEIIFRRMRRDFQSMGDVEAKFKSWDIDGDGAISFAELQSAVAKSGQQLTEEEMNAIFVMGDADQDGAIDLEEFKKLMLPTTSDVVSKFRKAHATVDDVQAAFKKFDVDGDGSIDRDEMTKALGGAGQNFSEQEINVIFNAADVDKDGTVDFEEFIGLMCPSAADTVAKFRGQYVSIDDVKAAFKRFDVNGDGALDKQEISSALKSSGQTYSDLEVDTIFSLGDVDGDGEITLEEFVALMSPAATDVVNRLRKKFKNINDVKKEFRTIDTDNDGLLSKEEVMASAGNKFIQVEVDAIFELGDIDGDNQIDMKEFIGLMYPAAAEVVAKLGAGFKNEEDIKASFKTLDVDGDGSISRDELAASGHKFTQEQIDAIFALGDIDDDGAISLEEYIGVMSTS